MNIVFTFFVDCPSQAKQPLLVHWNGNSALPWSSWMLSIWKGTKVQRKTKNKQNGTTLPTAEMSALKELEELLQNTGYLIEGESIPVVLKDEMEINDGKIAAYAENNTVVAVSLRYCALTSLPESLGQLAHLQQLDVTGNELTALPESLGNLPHLEEIHGDMNSWPLFPRPYVSLRTSKRYAYMATSWGLSPRVSVN